MLVVVLNEKVGEWDNQKIRNKKMPATVLL